MLPRPHMTRTPDLQVTSAQVGFRQLGSDTGQQGGWGLPNTLMKGEILRSTNARYIAIEMN